MNESEEERSLTLGLGEELAECRLAPHSIVTHVLS